MTPATAHLLDHLEREGRFYIPIPTRLAPDELAAAMLATVRVVDEVARERPHDLYVAVVRGSHIAKPTAQLVWVLFTAAGAETLSDAERRELGL